MNCAPGCVFVKKADVPAYFHEGEFYKSLSDEDNEEILVPDNTLKPDPTVNSNEDLDHLLSSLRFWGVSDTSMDIVTFCLCNESEDCRAILINCVEQFSYAAALLAISECKQDNGERSMSAIQSGSLEIVCAMNSNGHIFLNGCITAAEYRQPHLLKYFHEQGEVLGTKVFSAAIHNGCVACVKYVYEYAVDLEWPMNTLTLTLLIGHYECFQYALNNGCQWREEYDHILAYADSNADKLKYAIQHGFLLSKYATNTAASHRAVKCLQVLHEAQCPWDGEAINKATENGHEACVQFALMHGCPVSGDATELAARKGHLSILQHLHEAGVQWDESTCSAAAKGGHLACLQYAHENGCPWDANTTLAAANSGGLRCSARFMECLQYAHDYGSDWDASTAQIAAAPGKTLFRCSVGNMECLRYAYEQGCPSESELARLLLKL